MSKRILNVLTQSDENYVLPGGVMVTSLCENNQHLDEINVYYLSLGISTKSTEKLQSLTKKYKNLRLSIIDSKKYQRTAEDLRLSKWNGKQITWFKLLALSELKIDSDRILFLNPHSLIVGSLDYLIDLEFSHNMMYNIYDYSENFPGFVGIKKASDNTEPYYNCGLMLINHKAWLAENMGEKVKRSLEQKSDYKIADQDFCNVFFKQRIGTLPFEYYAWETVLYYYNKKASLKLNRLYNAPNYYTYEDVLCGTLTPRIIYLTSISTGRAWQKDNRAPSKFLFKRYMDLSPFKEMPMPEITNKLPYYISSYAPRRIVMLLNFAYSFARLNLSRKS
jgi:lipopolysaccharide biosynthesis glycosyltransferase